MIIEEVASHRNGCFGEPFHAVRFWADGEIMVGIVFEGERQCAVLNAQRAAETVEFGVNSYRGDVYEPALRAAIASFEAARSINPVHPASPMLRLVVGG